MDPATSQPGEPAPVVPGRSRGPAILVAAVVLVVVAVAIGAIAILPRTDAPAGSSAPVAGSSPSGTPAASATAVLGGGTGSTARPIALPGSIVVVDGSGSLSVVGRDGRQASLSGDADALFGFPAWSPDGSRIAVVRTGATEPSISVFSCPDGSCPAAEPVVIYRNGTMPPFYLSWAPDSRSVSFLATDADVVSLRIAPADGSAPLDGSGPGAMIRRGSPLYFDWIDAKRLLVHLGTGPTALLGEIGLDGQPAAPTLERPGDFRAAVISPDRRYLAYARADPGGSGTVVVAARDGSGEHTMPVFGSSAVLFDPTGDRVAALGPDKTGLEAMGFPIGPLRLIDAGSGDVRTLLGGTVVGFFWSPDGGTIAALRLQPVGASSADAGPIMLAAAESPAVASPAPSSTPPSGETEVRLIFVDVASGKIRSQRVVRLGSRFIGELLPYFDQYALSHRLWAPDGSSILLPLVDPVGRTQLAALRPDGGESPFSIPGEIGIWSP